VKGKRSWRPLASTYPRPSQVGAASLTRAWIGASVFLILAAH